MFRRSTSCSRTVCVETKQAILIVDLADFLVDTHKSICEHVTWKRRWVIGDHILRHGCVTFFIPLRAKAGKDVATRWLPENFFPCRMQKYMNKTRHVTCDLPSAHDKHSQIARQMRVFVLVAVQARCQFFSLRHTLRACACVKHECLCRRISCDTSTDLLPNPGLPVLFSDTLDSFLPSPALCSHNPIEMLLLGTPKKSRDIGISNKSCLGQIFTIPKTVTSREISDIQKVFELTAVFDQIFQFFVSENQIETPLLY